MFKKHTTGFTLIETLVGTAVFVIIAISVYQTYSTIMKVIYASRIKITAVSLVNEQFEMMRSISYTNVDIIDDTPTGEIPSIQNIIRNNKEFTLKTSILNIDDAFDGTAEGTPPDSTPIDYKLVEVEISCEACTNFSAFSQATYIAP